MTFFSTIKMIVRDFFLQARANMMHKHRCGRAAVRIFLPPLLH